jgi:hypothetical protein
MKPIDEYYHYKEEPVKSCLMALREYILQLDPGITEAWKYKMPFFCYKGKMFCYLWVHKKTLQPYIGIVEGRQIEHPLLIQEARARMKIMLFNAEEDIPIKTISKILKQALALYS